MKQLLKDLIAIRSDVNGSTNEAKIAEYIEKRLSKIDELKITRQAISDNRWNLIVSAPGEAKVLLMVHMDSVPLSEGWTKSISGADVEEEKMYGHGAFDPKGSIAAMITTIEELAKLGKLQDFLAVFYCGEEYDLVGMRKFVQSASLPSLELAIACEPTNMMVGYALRGLVEIELSVTGKTGNAALGSGVSASKGLVHILANLEHWLNGYSHSILGSTSLNIASIKTSLRMDEAKEMTTERQGNIVPDYGYALIDIRTVHPEADADSIKEFIVHEVDKQGLVLADLKINHDLNPLFMEKQDVTILCKAVEAEMGEVKFLDPTKTGWSDIELVYSKFKIPCCFFGPKGGNLHSTDEWLEIESVQKVSRILVKALLSVIR